MAGSALFFYLLTPSTAEGLPPLKVGESRRRLSPADPWVVNSGRHGATLKPFVGKVVVALLRNKPLSPALAHAALFSCPAAQFPRLVELWLPSVFKLLAKTNGERALGDKDFTSPYFPFPAARSFVGELKLRSMSDWHLARRTGQIPVGLPFHPHRAYRHAGWLGFPDFLSGITTGLGPAPRSHVLRFEDARSFARAEGFTTREQWDEAHAQHKLLYGIPANPSQTYRNTGWAGWKDFFGVSRVPSRRTRLVATLDEMRTFFAAHPLPYGGAPGYQHFRQGCFPGLPPCPPSFPRHPARFFATQWPGWFCLLGVPARRVRTEKITAFPDARAFILPLGLRSAQEFQLWRVGRLPGKPPRPLGFPSNPQVSYANKGWRGYPHFLGKQTCSN